MTIAVRAASVIICTQNRSDLLPKVVGQVRGQDYPGDALEIIVVDHRSTDSTPRVVGRLEEEPGIPVRYVPERSPGITFARNRGAEEARHPYLVYLDDDCSVAPDWLHQLLGGFDLHERVVAVGGRVRVHWDERKPAWLSPRQERWFAANGYLGKDPRLLAPEEHIVEGNMALERKAWQEAGGFLGMEQFGSRDMAAGEILYLLHKLHHQGGMIAYIPQALAVHHVGKSTWPRLLRRAYWQGVSDGVLDYLLYRRLWESRAGRIVVDLAALTVLCGFASFSFFTADGATGTFNLLRAARRLGLLLSESRMVGDWPRARSWLSVHPPVS